MAERSRPQFGDMTPRRTSRTAQADEMFADGTDLPIFSGTPQQVIEKPYVAQDHGFRQAMLPGMPAVDYEHIRELDRQLRRRRSKSGPVANAGTLWRYEDSQEMTEESPQVEEAGANLAAILDGYQLDVVQLRRLVAMGSDINELLRQGTAPEEVIHLIGAISTLLRPGPKEQIRSPADAAGFLMAEMGHLDHEELRTVLLDTKNHLQAVVTVYSGSLNASMVRVGEVYKDALRRNSAAQIVAHNHPSSDPTPSPEDVLVTREIVEASQSVGSCAVSRPEDVLVTREIVEVGRLLDVECLDHPVIGQGKWVSMREKGLGFNK